MDSGFIRRVLGLSAGNRVIRAVSNWAKRRVLRQVTLCCMNSRADFTEDVVSYPALHSLNIRGSSWRVPALSPLDGICFMVDPLVFQIPGTEP